MLLRTIELAHVGPFSTNATLELESDVTVITGPNDVGKTLLLKSIVLLCRQQSINEQEVNFHRQRETQSRWELDREIGCKATFETTDSDKTFPLGRRLLAPNHLVSFTRCFAPSATQLTTFVSQRGEQKEQREFTEAIPFPVIIDLPLSHSLRSVISLKEMNPAEAAFIRVGFGTGFTLDKHRAMDDFGRTFSIEAAQQTLNDRIQQFMGAERSPKFLLREVSGKPDQLGVGVVDRHSGFSSIESRGAGARKMIALMGKLVEIEKNNRDVIVLFDEPETSLHADSQHVLRSWLERLGAHPSIQVVYTTHSPAMINSFRPQSIRVVERESRNGKAVSVIRKSGFENNFLKVRSSLGMSPADSLLYCPITVVCEGATEILCIQSILEKLRDSGKMPDEDFERVLSLTHFLDGEGGKMEYMCRLAESQGSRVVVFHDGDDNEQIRKIREKHRGIPVVLLDKGNEFEDLIPRQRYLDAINSRLEGKAEVTIGAFEEWLKSTTIKPGTMFSKQVARFLNSMDLDLPAKPNVMRTAIDICDVSEIHTEPFLQLFDEIRKLAATL